MHTKFLMVQPFPIFLQRISSTLIPHITKLIHDPVPIGKDESEVVYGVTANKLAKKMRISDQTARNYLNTMAERGVLTYTQPKRRLKVYEFIVPEDEIKKKLEVTSVEPIEDTLVSEFEKEAEEFLKGYQFKRNVEVEDEEIGEITATAPPHFRSNHYRKA